VTLAEITAAIPAVALTLSPCILLAAVGAWLAWPYVLDRWLARCAGRNPERRRNWAGNRAPRKRRTERQARTLLSMPPGHPEWLTGGEKAARTGDFASWGAELEQDGLDAGSIIDSFRRGL